jgi:RNA polymerase sigma-70 factor (sigma-E family)
MAGHDKEFTEYFTGRYPTARRIAFTLCHDWLEAEELAQEAFVRLYARWPRIRSYTLDAYLRTVLVRLFLDRHRGQRGREQAVADPPDRPVESAIEAATDRDAMLAALAQVPPRQRAALVLRFALDLPVETVAEILRCSAGTVKSQTARGLDTLRSTYTRATTETGKR